MKAIDTNILVRFFVDDADDPEAAQQRPIAAHVLQQRCFIPVTVVLEFEWVLRGFYAFPKADIERSLRALLGVAHWLVEDRNRVLAAVDAYAAGLDFADALHVARSDHTAGFLTLERKLRARAARIGLPIPVASP